MIAGEPTVFLVNEDASARQSQAASVGHLQLPVECFPSTSAFLKQFDPSRPGCLIIEVRSTSVSGLEMLEKFRREGVYLPAVVLASGGDVRLAVRAMRAGATTFLEKPFSEQELWDSLQESFRKDAEYRQRHARVARIRRRLDLLTEGEKEVLELLLEGEAHREIAEKLEVSIRTVEVRRSKVMEKMRATSLVHLVRDALLVELHPLE